MAKKQKYDFKVGQKVTGTLIVGGQPVFGKVSKKGAKLVIETKLALYYLDSFSKIE